MSEFSHIVSTIDIYFRCKPRIFDYNIGVTQDQITILQTAIKNIEARNRRVEKDKAWETSNTRRFLIMILTYIVMVSFMSAIGNDKPFVNALIPTTGFFLSTLTLSFTRRIWERY